MLFEPLFDHARQIPENLAVADESGRYTFGQLGAMAAGMGMFLAMQTSKPRVGILLPASAAFAASFYGTLLAGKSVVPLNFLLGDKEIAHCIADSGIDTVVTMPLLAGRLKDTQLKVIDITQLPKKSPISTPASFPKVQADDLAVLMYTSGTSGLPKGVELTYGNLQSVVDCAIEAAHLEHKHSFLGVIPLFHSFGIVGTLLAPMQLGSPVFYIGRFSPVAAMNAIRDNKITLVFGVPSMFAALARLKSAKADDLSHVYAAISGGEPLPGALREVMKAKFNVDLLEGYGLTETAAIVGLNTPQEHKAGSVGKPLPHAMVNITDDDGKALPRGQTGEIWVQGPMVMKQYHDLPKESAEALTPDRFFKTGDLGHLDEEGYLFITGRKKDMIAVAGEKCYPREIEEVLGKHPAVGESAVLGKKDESRGEVVVAFVVAKEGQSVTADALRDFARKEGLAQWKVPREIFIVEDLPRSPTGKVLKRELAQKLATMSS
jgi:long-chain acyl-CoA synthetase